jgi:hypothetical protein
MWVVVVCIDTVEKFNARIGERQEHFLSLSPDSLCMNVDRVGLAA